MRTSELLHVLEARADAPGYQRAGGAERCENCRSFDKDGLCVRYSFKANPSYTCRSWRPANSGPSDQGDRTKNAGLAST